MFVRSRSGKPVYIATKKGPCGTFDHNWVEVSGVLLNECLARADLIEFADTKPELELVKKPEPVTPVVSSEVIEPSTSEVLQLKLADTLRIMMINPEQGYFTSAGLPNVNVVRKLVGADVNKEEVLAIYEKLVAEKQ